MKFGLVFFFDVFALSILVCFPEKLPAVKLRTSQKRGCPVCFFGISYSVRCLTFSFQLVDVTSWLMPAHGWGTSYSTS